MRERHPGGQQTSQRARQHRRKAERVAEGSHEAHELQDHDGLFVLPGILAIMVLSYIYAGWGNLPIMVALFLGLKAAVLRRIPVRAAG
jgi:hypothetical protein